MEEVRIIGEGWPSREARTIVPPAPVASQIAPPCPVCGAHLGACTGGSEPQGAPGEGPSPE